MSNKIVVVIQRSNAIEYTVLKSLSRVKLSAESESAGEEAILTNTYLSQATYILSSSTEKAIHSLKNNEFDAIVIDYTIAADNIANGDSYLMIIVEIDTNMEMYAVGFRVDSDMTIKVNEIINKMINDGTIESITKKCNLFDLYS